MRELAVIVCALLVAFALGCLLQGPYTVTATNSATAFFTALTVSAQIVMH
jgi:hypothetical protein